MSAIPRASGLPTPSPSRSGAGGKRGAFPPRPKSVRVLAVLSPDTRPSQQEGEEPEREFVPHGSASRERAISQWGAIGLLLALLALVLVLVILLGSHLGK